MRFRDAANRHNTLQLTDAYTGAPAGFGQLLPFDDARRDSVNTLRRILSLAPDATVPARGAVTIDGTAYLLGSDHTDYFRGAALRRHRVAHEAAGLATLRTPAEVCSGASGTQAYCGTAFIKHLAYEQLGSQLVPEYYVYTAPVEPVDVGTLVTLAGRHYLVRAWSLGETGLRLATAEQLADGALTTATYSTGVYDRVTETMTAGTATATCLMVRWQALFSYAHPQAPKMDASCVVMLMSPTVDVGTRVQVGGKDYIVRWASPAAGCTAYTLVAHET